MADIIRYRGEVGVVVSDFSSPTDVYGVVSALVRERGNSDFILVLSSDERIEEIWKKVDPLFHRHIFTEREMNYDILGNSMVPPHRRASGEEMELLKPYIHKLPILLSYDPVVRRMGFRIGDIVAIERKEGGIHYRRVSPRIDIP